MIINDMAVEIIEKLCMIIELQDELIYKLYSTAAQNDELDAEIARLEEKKDEIR